MRSVVRVHSCPLIVWSVGQGVKTPPFHGGNTGSNPVRTIYLEDYPSPAEGNGLENRQAGKTVQEFESLILLFIYFYIIAGWSSSVARRAHNPKVVGSNPAPAIAYLKQSFSGLVVQLVRMPACHAGGHEFESRTHR